MAEYVLIPQDALLPVPDGVDLTGAAIVACAVGSSYQALVRIARVLPGETVAVAGAGGGLGIHAVQIARALGSKVVALTSSADKIDLLRELGAAHVLLNRKGCYKDLLDITSGRGVDVVVDLVGHPDSFDDCFRGLSQRGRYVLAGQVYGRRVSVHPFFVFSTEKVITGSSSTLMSTFMHSMDLVQQGKVRPIVQTYPFAEAAKVHADMDGRRVMGRAVLVPPFS
jgi:D-arabinose 1-dehydrogenase-like Zn-dependent alcohol dehydrogenase